MRRMRAKRLKLACNGNAAVATLAEILAPHRPGDKPITIDVSQRSPRRRHRSVRRLARQPRRRADRAAARVARAGERGGRLLRASRCRAYPTLRRMRDVRRTIIAMREPGPPTCCTSPKVPLPAPKAGEVLIEVAYAGVNRPDCLQRAGAYPPPADASPIVGLEVAGRIAALGEGVTEWKRRRRRLRAHARRRLRASTARRLRDSACRCRRACRCAKRRACPENLLHRLVQPVRAHPLRCRRIGADPRRHQRHRAHRDPAVQGVRRDGVHDRGVGRQGRVLPHAWAPITPSTTGRRTGAPKSGA